MENEDSENYVKLHKNSINFRNREEIGGRKYCQNQLLNRRRTIVEQRNGNVNGISSLDPELEFRPYASFELFC